MEWTRYWPVILIAIGLVKLVDSTSPGGQVAGVILVGLGAIFLGQTLGYLNGAPTRPLAALPDRRLASILETVTPVE